MVVVGLEFLSIVADANRAQYNVVPTVVRGEDVLALAIAYATICLVIIQITLAWSQILLANRQIRLSRQANDLAERVLSVEEKAFDIAAVQGKILLAHESRLGQRAELSAFLRPRERGGALAVIVRNDGARSASGFRIRLYYNEGDARCVILGRSWTDAKSNGVVVRETDVKVEIWPDTEYIVPSARISRRLVEFGVSFVKCSLHYRDGRTPATSAEYLPVNYGELPI